MKKLIVDVTLSPYLLHMSTRNWLTKNSKRDKHPCLRNSKMQIGNININMMGIRLISNRRFTITIYQFKLLKAQVKNAKVTR